MKDKTYQGKDSGGLMESPHDDPHKKTIVSQETEDGVSQSDDSHTSLIVKYGNNVAVSSSNKSANAKVHNLCIRQIIT